MRGRSVNSKRPVSSVIVCIGLEVTFSLRTSFSSQFASCSSVLASSFGIGARSAFAPTVAPAIGVPFLLLTKPTMGSAGGKEGESMASMIFASCSVREAVSGPKALVGVSAMIGCGA